MRGHLYGVVRLGTAALMAESNAAASLLAVAAQQAHARAHWAHSADLHLEEHVRGPEVRADIAVHPNGLGDVTSSHSH